MNFLKQTRLFKTVFTTLMILCVIVACQQDDVIDEQEQVEPIFNLKIISSDQLPEQLGLQKALSDAKMALSINTTFHKSVYDSVNGFWIDDSHINQVTSGNYESYTFGVYDPADSLSIKNLILHKVSDSTYVPILFTYPTTPIDSLSTQIEYEILNDGLAITFYKADIRDFMNPCGWNDSDCACWRLSGNVITIETTSDDCTFYEADTDVQYQDASFTDPVNDGSNGGGSANTNDPPPTGDNNTSPGADINGGVSSSGNPSSGGDSPDDGSNDDSNTDTTQQDNSLQFSDGSRARVVSAPILEFIIPVDDDTQTFFDSLPDTLKEFINNPDQNNLREDIQQFLQDENNSIEAQDFAKEAVEALKENKDYDVDYEDRIINKLDKDSRKCHVEILNNIQNQNGPIIGIINTIFNAGHNPNNLIFSESTINTNPAWSYDKADGTYDIFFNPNFLDNATDLAFVMALLHEMMHTNLSYLNKKDVLPYQNIQPSFEHHEYADLVQAFLAYTATTNQGNDNDHQFMAAHYLELLSQATYDWAITPVADGGGGYDPNDTSLKPHLDKLAWIGLSQSDFYSPPGNVLGGNSFITPAWQDLVNTDINEAQEILNVLASEFFPNDSNNQTLSKGNSLQSCP